MTTRFKLLNSLLQFDKPLIEILPPLSALGWDSEETIICLQKQHFTQILQRYLNNELSASDIEDWANAIEGHEDIGYESDSSELLADAIFELANPQLTDPISKKLAQNWLTKFTQLTVSIPE